MAQPFSSVSHFQLPPVWVNGRVMVFGSPRAGPLCAIFGLVCARELVTNKSDLASFCETYEIHDEDARALFLKITSYFASLYIKGNAVDRDGVLQTVTRYVKEIGDPWLDQWVGELLARADHSRRH